MDYASPGGGTDTSTDLDIDKMNPAVLITTTLVSSLIVMFDLAVLQLVLNPLHRGVLLFILG
jgi:hypothetical protein